MLDIKFIRENKKLVEKNNASRNVKIDLDELLDLDAEKTKLQQQADALRATRNQRSKTKPSDEEIVLMKKLGGEISGLEELAGEKEEELREILYKIPNLKHESVPVGKDESENKVVRTWGKPRVFNFEVKDHLEIGERLNVIDTKTAAVVTGARFAYLKGNLALLEFALIQHAFSLLTNTESLKKIIETNKLATTAKSFVPVIPPVMIRPEVMRKMGRLEPKEERYHLDEDDLYLVGSAEHTMGPLHMDAVLNEADLPIRYVGFSTAFRREAGSYGKDTKGIFRVHQFDKIEIESFCAPADSLAEQDFIIAIQEHLMQSLGLPYQIVLKCTGDMGLPDFREFDVETWLPSQKKYRETHTSDCMTDYQSRRLNTRIKKATGGTEFAHMNDATVFAIGRTLIAIIENYQQEDGSVLVPEVLQKYAGFSTL